DMIIPRGGETLQRFCQQHATIPVIMGGIGVCHIFVEQTADQQQALDIIINAKTSRPSVCNAVETVLIEQSIAGELLPKLSQALAAYGVTLHMQATWLSYLQQAELTDKA